MHGRIFEISMLTSCHACMDGNKLPCLCISEKKTHIFAMLTMDGEILHHASVEKETYACRDDICCVRILWTSVICHTSINCVPQEHGKEYSGMHAEYYRLSMHHSLRLFCKTKLFLNRNQQPRDGTQIDLC